MQDSSMQMFSYKMQEKIHTCSVSIKYYMYTALKQICKGRCSILFRVQKSIIWNILKNRMQLWNKSPRLTWNLNLQPWLQSRSCLLYGSKTWPEPRFRVWPCMNLARDNWTCFGVCSDGECERWLVNDERINADQDLSPGPGPWLHLCVLWLKTRVLEPGKR